MIPSLPVSLRPVTRRLRFRNAGIAQFHSSQPPLFLDAVQNWLSRIGRKTTLGASTALFTVCQNHCRHSYWQKHAKIGDDFRSTHMLLVTHVWMCHHRLLKEGKRGLLVQESLFDQLWDDTCNRIYKRGVPEISLNKYLKEVQSYSFRTCVEFDQALKHKEQSLESLNAQKLKELQEIAAEEQKQVELQQTVGNAMDFSQQLFQSPEEAVIDGLAGALWRGVYLRREDVDEELVLSIARYVRSEQERLLSLPTDAFFEGKFAFSSIAPFLASAHSGIQSQSKKK